VRAISLISPRTGMELSASLALVHASLSPCEEALFAYDLGLWRQIVDGIIYLVGLIVIIMFILSLLGLH
jgi:hypothetical protein